MMKLSSEIILACFFLLSVSLSAQTITSQKDSTVNSTITLYDLSGDNIFIPEDSSFRISPQSSFQTFNLAGINDSATVWLRTRIAIMNNGFGFEETPVSISDMMHPYLNFYIESKNISLIRRVLGIAQLGAAGYLAYKHIKKYGLFN